MPTGATTQSQPQRAGCADWSLHAQYDFPMRLCKALNWKPGKPQPHQVVVLHMNQQPLHMCVQESGCKIPTPSFTSESWGDACCALSLEERESQSQELLKSGQLSVEKEKRIRTKSNSLLISEAEML